MISIRYTTGIVRLPAFSEYHRTGEVMAKVLKSTISLVDAVISSSTFLGFHGGKPTSSNLDLNGTYELAKIIMIRLEEFIKRSREQASPIEYLDLGKKLLVLVLRYFHIKSEYQHPSNFLSLALKECLPFQRYIICQRTSLYLNCWNMNMKKQP